MNIQLSDENLTRIKALVESGEYPSWDDAANALIEQALDARETVKYDNNRLAMGLDEERLNSVLKMLWELALERRGKWATVFRVTDLINLLPESVTETLTPKCRTRLGSMFRNKVDDNEIFETVGYSRPTLYKHIPPQWETS